MSTQIRFNYHYHPDMTSPTIDAITKKSGWIFVYNSNLAGAHGSGAALEATKFGARQGVGFGLERESFGIPTKDKKIQTMTLIQIHQYVTMARRQITHRLENTFERYWFTRIGCGNTGYKDYNIAPMFAGLAAHLAESPDRLTKRVSFPIEWRQYLEPELHNDAILEELLFKEPTHIEDLNLLKDLKLPKPEDSATESPI